MELRALLPIVVAVIVAFVLLRLVMGAIKTSAKLMVWAVVAAAVFGARLPLVRKPGDAGRATNCPR